MTAASNPGLSAARVTPGLTVRDENAAYWIARVILTLRREICWCWQVRNSEDPLEGRLPPVVDSAAENLDLVRYEADKARFFDTDPTARYLSDQIDRLAPAPSANAPRGSWAWLAERLELDEASQFVLGLVLAARLDAGLGPVLAACLNDRARPFPTLALAQRLWHDALAIAACADASHPLFRYGLLTAGDAAVTWLSPLDMHAPVARQVADPQCDLPAGLRVLDRHRPMNLDARGRMLANRLASRQPGGLEIVPFLGPEGAGFEDWAATLAAQCGRTMAAVDDVAAADPSQLAPLAVTAWLRDLDLLLPETWADRLDERDWARLAASVTGIPVRWYVPVTAKAPPAYIPRRVLTPPLVIAPLSFEERAALFREGFGDSNAQVCSAIDECSRRFRFERNSIDQIVAAVRAGGIEPDLETLIVACRNEASSGMDGLAQLVTPRFRPEELVLPPKQRQQFNEILNAMRLLTEVHYHWGAAAAWNEGGITALFYGAPGTGKTMAAEALANALSLPMYRIDLSQVMNKYIGETEKNLKRIFDAAEMSDSVLFFDEADALFGKRTEVKDAHDRFANIEVSYLLERMERFKGLAILATNRKKDLDEAFLRRLRFVVEFPMPGVSERERIWRQAFPPLADTSSLDFAYLARQFTLSGGHIRSVAFAACLQSAAAGPAGARAVQMDAVMSSIKRELDKLNRAAGEAVFGAHGERVREHIP